jgi:hypothetical protein
LQESYKDLEEPLPPGMSWVVVLAISLFTCGLFPMIWLLIQANWVRKIDAESKSFLYLVSGFIGLIVVYACAMGIIVLGAASESTSAITTALGSALSFGGFVLYALLYIFAVFQMKSAIETHFGEEGFPVSMNPILVFFFAPLIFQFEFGRFLEFKKGPAPASAQGESGVQGESGAQGE